MTGNLAHRIACVAVCGYVVFIGSPEALRAQFGTPSPSEALTAAAKASPELANGLAKEIQSTPEQAAGAAGLIFGIAKSLLTTDDFAQLSKAVPGMDALLAAAPAPMPAPSALALTPGFAPSSSTPAMTMAAPDGMASAASGFSKLGIKPEMIAKAIPFLSGYLKKHGGAAIGSLLGGLFKGAK